MKLTKTLLSVAVAGVAAAPMMASATTTLSGAVQIELQGSDSEDPHTNANGEDGFEDGEPRIAAGDVLLGVVASQTLNSGLTGYGSLRFDLDSISGAGTAESDNVYVGISGGFGDLRFGEVGNPGEFGQVAGDLHDAGGDFNAGVGYVGSFGGATIGLSWSPATNDDAVAVGAKFQLGGFGVGVGAENRDEITNVTFGATFAIGGFSIGVAGSVLEDGFGSPATAAIPATATEDAVAATASTLEDETHAHVQVGFSFAGASITGGFSQATEQESVQTDLTISYDLGGGMDISANTGSQTIGDGDTTTDWEIQLSKSF